LLKELKIKKLVSVRENSLNRFHIPIKKMSAKITSLSLYLSLSLPFPHPTGENVEKS
jgi:hypothetical protein